MRQLKADQGFAKINEIPNTNSDIFRHLTFLKDNSVLYEYMSGWDHLQLIASMQGIDANRVEEIISKRNLRSFIKDRVSSYSLGMKQHLLIAMALLPDTEILILDEPLNGLDPTSVLEFRDLVKNLVEQEKIVLLSSHTLSEIDYITDKILFLKEGRIIDEDLSTWKVEEYRYTLEKNHLEKLKQLVFPDDWKDRVAIQDDSLHFRGEQDLWEFHRFLAQNDIAYRDVEKVKIGAEERYRMLFADEIEQGKRQ